MRRAGMFEDTSPVSVTARAIFQGIFQVQPERPASSEYTSSRVLTAKIVTSPALSSTWYANRYCGVVILTL